MRKYLDDSFNFNSHNDKIGSRIIETIDIHATDKKMKDSHTEF
jgi:hypothetical protein